MTSKQEKLAAARKKLKEFQGKNKGAEMVRQKNVDQNLLNISMKKPFSQLPESSSASISLKNDNNGKNVHQSFHVNHTNYIPCLGQSSFEENQIKKNAFNSMSEKFDFSNAPELNQKQNDTSDRMLENLAISSITSVKESNSDSKTNFSSDSQCPKFKLIHNFDDEFPEMSRKEKHLNTSGQEYDFSKSLLFDNNNQSLVESNLGKNFSDHKNVSTAPEPSDSLTNEEKDFDKISDLNEVIKHLQVELASHIQTINLLIQQRNDAQSRFVQVQDLLNEKLGEVEKLDNHVANLSATLKDSQKKFLEAEELIKILKLEKSENIKKDNEIQSLIFTLKGNANSKEEKYQEFKRKYEEKSKECEKLLADLQKTQSQLSLSQIQNQQLSAMEHSSQFIQVSLFEKENLILKQKVNDLEKRLETDNAEKEQSGQQFFLYAQQCNSEITNLNSVIKNLSADNDVLKEKNKLLSEKLSELNCLKEKNFSCTKEEESPQSLQDDLNVLTKKNKDLENELKEKVSQEMSFLNSEEECKNLVADVKNKNTIILELQDALKEAETENKKLFAEAEIPKVNDKLLAVMESEKVAAAKAVSQNQKLKQQIMEFEEAFIKLNEEKLELTNLLASEKHANLELQKLLKKEESEERLELDSKCSKHYRCPSEPPENPERLINDSNEIEELRTIIRQLQDDKVELTARLVMLESRKSHSEKGEEEKKGERDEKQSEADCESTNLLLRRMEEKVRKTMNEIAVLDEEKEKLEHLVLQLQGETETIGEYITLYQTQRRLLQQRAREKDDQLLQLSKDKEELKNKLSALDELVQRLVRENQRDSLEPGTSEDVPPGTAGKIRALISEIESGSWINNHAVAFEHCSCCSGRLIVI